MLGRVLWMLITVTGLLLNPVGAQPHRILVDTDVNIDDVLALFYLLKQNNTQFDLKVYSFSF